MKGEHGTKKKEPPYPCDACAEKDFAAYGACNHGIGICEKCLDYWKERREARYEKRKS